MEGMVDIGGVSDSGLPDTDYDIYQLEDEALSPTQVPSAGYAGAPDSGFVDFLANVLSDPDALALVEDYAEAYSLSVSDSSYLSTTQLDLFDRILDGEDYRYYIAYRTGSDSYGAVLYACDDITVSGSRITMDEPMQFQLYRTYSGSTYHYYYTHSQLSSDSVTLNSNILYYTNMVGGYPLLAGQGSSQVQWSAKYMPLAIVFMLFLLFLVLRRGK